MGLRGPPKGTPKTPGSGRKRGTPNRLKSPSLKAKMAKAQAEALERIENSVAKQTPLEFCLEQMRDVDNPPGFRLECARACIGYVHAKKAEEIGEKPVIIEKIERVIIRPPPQLDDPAPLDELPRTVVEPVAIPAARSSALDAVAVAGSRLDKMRGIN
jgi:hypothetical protein